MATYARNASLTKRGAACLVPLLLALSSMAQLASCLLGMQYQSGGFTYFFTTVPESTWCQPLLGLYVLDLLCAVPCAYLSCYLAQRWGHGIRVTAKVLGAILMFFVMRGLVGAGTIYAIIWGSGEAQFLVWALLAACLAAASAATIAAYWRQTEQSA